MGHRPGKPRWARLGEEEGRRHQGGGGQRDPADQQRSASEYGSNSGVRGARCREEARPVAEHDEGVADSDGSDGRCPRRTRSAAAAPRCSSRQGSQAIIAATSSRRPSGKRGARGRADRATTRPVGSAGSTWMGWDGSGRVASRGHGHALLVALASAQVWSSGPDGARHQGRRSARPPAQRRARPEVATDPAGHGLGSRRQVPCHRGRFRVDEAGRARRTGVAERRVEAASWNRSTAALELTHEEDGARRSARTVKSRMRSGSTGHHGRRRCRATAAPLPGQRQTLSLGSDCQSGKRSSRPRGGAERHSNPPARAPLQLAQRFASSA